MKFLIVLSSCFFFSITCFSQSEKTKSNTVTITTELMQSPETIRGMDVNKFTAKEIQLQFKKAIAQNSHLLKFNADAGLLNSAQISTMEEKARKQAAVSCRKVCSRLWSIEACWRGCGF